VVSSPRVITPTIVTPTVVAPTVVSSTRVIAPTIVEPERIVTPTVIAQPRTIIEPSKIVKGDAYEVARNFIGIGSPRSSYTVVDNTSPKTYVSSPSRARTSEELIREGYSPVTVTN
jgi:hypothetical protein